MKLHAFRVDELPATPWKNGGGTTREIVCRPAGAGMHGFDWRVSIASIAADGPFSAFPGVDRVILLLSGAGVRLHAPARHLDHGLDHRLETPLAPFAFAGDVALGCDLLGGPSTDFNVMTRRGLLRADVAVLRGAGGIKACSAGLVLAVGGAWQLAVPGHPAHGCAADSGVWWDAALPPLQATPLDAGAALVVVRIEEENERPSQPPSSAA